MEEPIRSYTESVESIRKLLRANKEREISALLGSLDLHHIADLLVDLTDDRRRLFLLLPPELQADALLLLDRQIQRRILHRLHADAIAGFLHFNDEDDAVDIMQLLPQHKQKEIAQKLNESKRNKISQLLEFDPQTAGGIMDLNFIIVKTDSSSKDIFEKINHHIERTKEVPVVIVTDAEDVVQGIIPFKQLFGISTRATTDDIIHRAPTVEYTVDQEALIRKLKTSKQDLLVVVDEDRHAIGIIHPKDILKVMERSATEGLYKFAGVHHEESVFDRPTTSVRYRYKWLLINMGTALLASIVVSSFSSTIGKFVLLAAYMPIVAGMGGNAGTQALAVVVRSIALGEVRLAQGFKIVKKELITGFLDGLIIGTILAFLVTLLHNDYRLGIILGVSILCNLMVAGIFGAFIPLLLKSLRLDPALSSSVFITAATDIIGFLIFLGLATIFLL